MREMQIERIAGPRKYFLTPILAGVIVCLAIVEIFLDSPPRTLGAVSSNLLEGSGSGIPDPASRRHTSAAPDTNGELSYTCGASTSHVSVEYERPADRAHCGEIVDIMENWWKIYMREKRPLPVSKVTVLLFGSVKHFQAVTEKESFMGAVTKEERIYIQPLDIFKGKDVLKATLGHEFAHAAMNSIADKEAPIWLKEGFAVYLSGQANLLWKRRKPGPTDLIDLDLALEYPQNEEDLSSAYWMAFKKVEDLIKKHGESYVWNLLRVGGID